jgi:hypothetical protein
VKFRVWRQPCKIWGRITVKGAQRLREDGPPAPRSLYQRPQREALAQEVREYLVYMYRGELKKLRMKSDHCICKELKNEFFLKDKMQQKKLLVERFSLKEK